MSLVLASVSFDGDTAAVAEFRDDDGQPVFFKFRLDGHGSVHVAHAEDVFVEAYLAVPGPDVAQAHELTRLIGELLLVRARPLPSGDDLARLWADVGDELEHDWALQNDE